MRLTASRAFGALTAAVGMTPGVRQLFDNSFLTHLATGRLILAEGFPRTDPYTFTAVGEPWIPQSWLASVVYAGLERAGGLELIRLANGLTTALLALVAWHLTAPAESVVRRLAVMAPFLGVGAFGWSHRPYLFALLCVGVLLLVLQGQLGARWLLPAGWLWLNVHGSWPLGLVLVATVWLGRRLDGEPADVERRAGALLVAGLLLGSLNPYGPRLLAFPLEAAGRREAFSSIREWQAPDFRSLDELAFLGGIGLVLVAMRRAAPWRAVLPAVVFIAAALVSARNIAVAAMVLVPLTAPGLAGRRFEPSGLALRGVAVVSTALATVSAVLALGSDPFGDEPYPVAADRWLSEHALTPVEARVIAHDYVGNWFEARYGPAAQVFVDDRVELLPIAVLRDARTLLDGGPGWEQVLDRYDAEAIVWERDRPLAQLLSTSRCWSVEHRDEKFIVAVPSPRAAGCSGQPEDAGS